MNATIQRGRILVAATAIIALPLLASCEGMGAESRPPDADDDDEETIDFYSFCCDQRCDFYLIEGQVEHGIATWHELDSGLGLQGDFVVLRTQDNNAGPSELTPDCYQVTIVADKDPAAELWLEVDVLADGENVAVKNIRADDWSTSNFLFKAPSVEGTMRFSLVKQGDSRAVLYFMEIDGVFGCGDNAEEVAP